MELLDSLPTSVLQELLDDFDPGPGPSLQDVSWNSKDTSSGYQATQAMPTHKQQEQPMETELVQLHAQWQQQQQQQQQNQQHIPMPAPIHQLQSDLNAVSDQHLSQLWAHHQQQQQLQFSLSAQQQQHHNMYAGSGPGLTPQQQQQQHVAPATPVTPLDPSSSGSGEPFMDSHPPQSDTQEPVDAAVLAATAAEELHMLRERTRNNQRRYRNRQKDRLREAEDRVAQLTAQLEASRLEQDALAAELAETKRREQQKATSGDCDLESVHDSTEALWWLDSEVHAILARTSMTYFKNDLNPSGPINMTPQEVAAMPTKERAMVWVRHVKAWAEYLLEMKGDANHPAARLLVQSYVNSCCFWNWMLFIPPSRVQQEWALMCKVFDDSMKSTAQSNRPVDYSQLARDLQITPEQVVHFTALRQAYLTNYGVIQANKARLTAMVKAEGIPRATLEELAMHEMFRTHVQVMADIQELLQREHCQLFLVMRIIWQHILTPLQGAFMSVKLYPTHPSALELMEAVAAPTGQAGHAELVAAGVAKAEAAGGDGKLDLIFLQGVVPPCHTEVVFSEMTAGEGP